MRNESLKRTAFCNFRGKKYVRGGAARRSGNTAPAASVSLLLSLSLYVALDTIGTAFET